MKSAAEVRDKITKAIALYAADCAKNQNENGEKGKALSQVIARLPQEASAEDILQAAYHFYNHELPKPIFAAESSLRAYLFYAIRDSLGVQAHPTGIMVWLGNEKAATRSQEESLIAQAIKRMHHVDEKTSLLSSRGIN